MVTEQAVPPKRGWSWIRQESTPLAAAVVILGAIAVALVIGGTIGVLAAHGLIPYQDVVRGLTSVQLRGVELTGIGLGIVAAVLGWGSYRRMPTKVSREEAIAGAVLGVQASVLAVILLGFSFGNVETFAKNVADFGPVRDQIGAFVKGARNTVVLAVAGEFFGILIGLGLAVFAVSSRAVVRAPARAYINFFRGTPLVWQLLFTSVVLPLGFNLHIQTYYVAIIVLSVNTGAYAAEVFRAGIQSIERGQLEAARSLGMSYFQALRYAIVPQAVRRVIPPLMNEFVILIKDTSLVIVLGLSESQYELMSVGKNGFGNTFNATFFVATAIGYLAVSLPAIRLVNILERRLRSGLVGVTA
ncbi:MAG: amino acid ABC transporter permease [Actinomycetota bacterium]